MLSREEQLLWVVTLHDECCRFYRDWVDNWADRFNADDARRTEFRDSIASIVGWIPKRLGEAEAESLQETVNVAKTILARTPGDSSARDDLQKLIIAAAEVVAQASRAVTKYRAECLATLGISDQSAKVN